MVKEVLAAAWSPWAGLTFVPAENPLDKKMLGGPFGQQRTATVGLALREEDWGVTPAVSVYSLRQVCLWGWGSDPPQRSRTPVSVVVFSLTCLNERLLPVPLGTCPLTLLGTEPGAYSRSGRWNI